MISQIHNFKQFSERKFILFKEGFISSVGSLQGVKHLVLLSQALSLFPCTIAKTTFVLF